VHLVVRAFPVLPSKEQDVEAFARELSGPRQAKVREFYDSYGVKRETWHFQPVPAGRKSSLSPRSRTSFRRQGLTPMRSSHFHRWFKDEVLRISGVNPNVDLLGPPSVQVFAWPPAA